MLTPDELNPILKTYGVSEKESHTLYLALEGNNHKDISKQLGIKPEAARKRLGEIYRKFGIKGRGSGKLAKLQQILLTQLQQQSLPIQAPPTKHQDPETPLIDWGNAPDPVPFYGRSQELETLQSYIQPEASTLISIVGLKGIGKTALAIQLVEASKEQFDVVFWRSLDISSSPTLTSIIHECLTRLNISPAASETQAIEQLMEQLRRRRCLLIFDGLDAVLPRQPRETETLSTLLTRIGAERHQSCLLVTSRENPRQLPELEGRGHPVHTLTLDGLKVEDAQQLIRAKKLKDDEQWLALIDWCQGNPLALQLITMRIHQFFGGQVREFLRQRTIRIQQIDDLVSNQFQFLSEQERILLSWLAVKNALSFGELKELLKKQQKWSGSEVMAILESLMRRSLIQGESKLAIHPLFKKYIVRDLLKTNDIQKLPTANEDIQALLERCLSRTSQRSAE